MTNNGPAAATDVMLEPLEELHGRLLGSRWPAVLPPGQHIDIPVVVTASTPTNPRVRLTWIDGAGSHDYELRVSL